MNIKKMQMIIRHTHIPEKIAKFRNQRISKQSLLDQVELIFKAEEDLNNLVIDTLQNGKSKLKNQFKLDLLETENIYHLRDIEKICIDYRLRFLDSRFFKGELPFEAVAKIKGLEADHDTKLEGFKIMAPAQQFKLENADDPLLFAPIGNDYFYLIHSWGNDLHPFRKLMMWPFKTMENFLVILLIISLILTSMVPEGLFMGNPTTAEYIMIFFFMFKWVAGLAIFIGFKKGKNFSTAIWRSKFYNA